MADGLLAVWKDEIESEVPGQSGLDLIHGSPVSGLTSTVLQDMIEELTSLVEDRISGFQEEGADIQFAPTLNIVGAGATAAYNGAENRIDLTIPGLLDEIPYLEGLRLNGIDQEVRKRIDLIGPWNIVDDVEGDALKVEVSYPDIPDATLPADVDVMGKSFLSAEPDDPAIPIALGANDPAVTNTRIPTANSVDVAAAAENIVFIERVTSSTHPIGREQGWVILETDTPGLPLKKQMSADPLLPDYQPIGRLADLPIAPDGEEDEEALVMAADTRLKDRRSPTALSVDLTSAAPDISLPYICSSTTRPIYPKHLQLTLETDWFGSMMNYGTPEEPDWQPFNAAAEALGLTFQEEGVGLALRDIINVQGEGATLVDDAINEKTLFKVPGVTVQANGTTVGSPHAILNLINATVTEDVGNKRFNVSFAPTLTSPVLESYREGLEVVWNTPGTNGNNITVLPGAAWIPSLNRILNVPTTLTAPAMAFAASTWYYLYLYDDAGTPKLEISTTAPADPYKATARIKTGDNSRRYLRSMRTDASGTPALYRWTNMAGDLVHYEVATGAAPFRIVSAGIAGANTTVGTGNLIPPHVRLAHMRLLANINSVYVGTPGINVDTHEVIHGGTSGTGSNGYVTPVLLDSSRQFFYRGSAATIDVLGWYDPF